MISQWRGDSWVFGSGRVILFVGRIEALKGIDNLVKALGILRNGTEASLLVVGGDEHSSSEVSRLKEMARNSGIIDSVQFIGPVPQSRLPLYYSAADVSVVASYYESFCLVVLESLACGTPVVSTQVGIAPAVISNENGCLLQDNNPENLADGLAAILRKGDMNKYCIRQTAVGYDWASIALRMESEYGDLAAEKCLPHGVSA
jgi:D-inositol-3-phosphate glycosyltransferase